MTDTNLTSASAIADWLLTHTRKGDGLTRPYARRWETAGRAATNFLSTWPANRVSDLADAVHSLEAAVVSTKEGACIELPGFKVWIGVNRSSRGDGPPDAFSVRLDPDALPIYVGNSPEVLGQLLYDLGHPSVASTIPADEVQVGFPGACAEPIYVGSPEWDIHGEVRGDEVVKLAIAATAAVIAKGRTRM